MVCTVHMNEHVFDTLTSITGNDNLLQTPKTLVLSGIFSTSRVNFQAEHSSELNFFWEHQSQRKTQFNKDQNVMTNENVPVSKYKSY